MVGAHKCGTSALFDYIAQHPLAFCPDEKEPCFFAYDYPELRGYYTYEDYLALFADANESHIAVGEASPVYFLSKVAAGELHKHYPDARLIIMFRNPVDMVHSFHSQMLITLNEDQPDFEQAWRMQDERMAGKNIPHNCRVPELLQYRNVGRMSNYAQAFLELFPAEQVRLIIFDDLKNDPRTVFDDTCAYLDLPILTDVDFRIVNANRAHKSKLLARLTDRPLPQSIENASAALKRAIGLGDAKIRRAISRRNIVVAPRKELSPDFRRELVAEFSDEVSRLETLTGRNLQHWHH
ncbi:MAG TPA: sulfotransferase [Gammaproteobacteria bacterium]|nr:sulfotransferase [Gammaproteobacteria bacterium]